MTFVKIDINSTNFNTLLYKRPSKQPKEGQ